MMETKKPWHFLIKLRDIFINDRNTVYLWFLNKFMAKEDEYYGLVEPSMEWMSLNNEKFWIQPCNNINEEEMK